MSAEAKFAASILILGATGKVGVPTVLALSKTAADVRVLVRDESKARQALGAAAASVKFVHGDLTDLKSVEAALKGVQRVFLIHPSGEPEGIAAVAKLAKAAGVQLFLHLSVAGASVTAPRNTIVFNHGRGEEEVAATGLPWVILRPPHFFQNWVNEAGSIKQGAIYRPSLPTLITHVDTRDIADAAVAVLTAADLSKHLGRTYLITGGEDAALTFEGIARTLSTAIGKEVKLVTVDDAGWYHALQQFGLPEGYAWQLLKLHQHLRTSGNSPSHGDFKLLTGKEQRTLAAYFTENKAAFL